MNDAFFHGVGIEVELVNPDKFNVVVETLSRIGFSPRGSNRLIQSCHILHKRGRYSIMHFKEMYGYDGCHFEMTEDDIARRNRIAKLLEDWQLIRIIDPKSVEKMSSMRNIRIVPHKDAADWTFEQKYSLGRRK